MMDILIQAFEEGRFYYTIHVFLNFYKKYYMYVHEM